MPEQDVDRAQDGQPSLILEIHGGPCAHTGAFLTEEKLYAAAAYAVLVGQTRAAHHYGAESPNLSHLLSGRI